MNPLSTPLDWLLDRTVVGGYTSVGYRLRGIEGQSADPRARLDGARVVITGANSGIGAAASEAFAALGAEVHMVCRDRARGERALAVIGERTRSDRLHLHVADLADLDQVHELAAELTRELDSIDVLVHNAGALLSSRERSPQGHELTFAVHVLAPLLLTHELRPQLEAADGSRVVTVTSGGMYTARLDLGDLQLERRDYDGPAFYAHAKRAQVVLTAELQRRFGGDVSFHAMHPGWTETPGVEKSLPRFHALTKPLLRSPEAGADTIVWLAAADRPPSEPGRLWMDRRPRPEHRVPWTQEEPGEAALLYEACAELAGFEPVTSQDRRPQDRRGPAGAVRSLPSP
jgi:NAD(P)-dependent dehydrogenase (short-subunit alcohol dehydrogenase family)